MKYGIPSWCAENAANENINYKTKGMDGYFYMNRQSCRTNLNSEVTSCNLCGLQTEGTSRPDMKGSEIQAAIHLTGYKVDKDYLSNRFVLRLLLRLDPQRHKYLLI
jgi:hypothetical protein